MLQNMTKYTKRLRRNIPVVSNRPAFPEMHLLKALDIAGAPADKHVYASTQMCYLPNLPKCTHKTRPEANDRRLSLKPL